jgi:lysozyme family protein
MSFDRAVAHVLAWEGGTVNDPRDRGGLTRYGISRLAYPDLDITHLTEADARAIYKRDYWNKLQCDSLPEQVAFALFDCAVNVGVEQATKILQRALGIRADGVLGPETMRAAKSPDTVKVVRDFTLERMQFYMSLSTYSVFGKGWLRRSIDTAMRAA